MLRTFLLFSFRVFLTFNQLAAWKGLIAPDGMETFLSFSFSHNETLWVFNFTSSRLIYDEVYVNFDCNKLLFDFPSRARVIFRFYWICACDMSSTYELAQLPHCISACHYRLWMFLRYQPDSRLKIYSSISTSPPNKSPSYASLTRSDSSRRDTRTVEGERRGEDYQLFYVCQALDRLKISRHVKTNWARLRL